MSQEISLKQIKIDKANRMVVIAIGVASFLTIFSLVTSKSLLSYYGYQNRVIGAKKTAVQQLKDDAKAVSQLNSSYQAFVTTPQNVLGGNTYGSSPNDGDNGKIILDALPSVYDFPGLTSSVENLFAGQPYTISSFSGVDQELTQQNPPTSLHPASVLIPVQLTAEGTYQNLMVGTPKFDSFIQRLQHSIRPFQVQTIDINGDDQDLKINVSANTYYQPGVSFQIGKENVQ